MKYRRLGSSGTIVSSYALGTMTFGAETDEDEARRVLDAYVAAGGNLIDTSNTYGRGTSETIVGNWLRRRPELRDELVIATKARRPMGTAPNASGASRLHLRGALDASLDRLGIDHIDLYQMHAWDPLTPVDETLRFLDDAVSSGKILYYGFSNYTGWQLTKAEHTAERLGLVGATTLQPQYSLLVRDIEAEIVPASIDRGLGLLPWSPLAAGWLTGKYRRDATPDPESRVGHNPTRGSEPWEVRNAKERTWRILDAVRAVAESHAVPMANVALSWLEHRPAVSSVILGVRTLAQLEQNITATELELSADEIDLLSSVSEPDFPGYPYGGTGTALSARQVP